MKTVFVSATGNYQQGNLTPQLFRDLCESEYSGESVPLILEESVPPNSGWI